MTTLAPAPATPAAPMGDTSAYLSISADLMPDEVLISRRLRELKRKIVIGMAGVVALLLAVYAISWLQTVSSRSDLSDAQNRATSDTKQLKNFQPLLTAQQQSNAIVTTLSNLMTNDLQWQTLLANLRKVAPAGTTLVTLTGSVTTTTAGGQPANNASGLSVLNTSGQVAVGSITITGSARDKNAVAAFADKLTSVKGIAAPFVSSVTGAKGDITFSINALITAKALGGRFHKTTTTTGGK